MPSSVILISISERFSAGFDFQIATVGHGLESVLNQVYQCHFEVAFRAADV